MGNLIDYGTSTVLTAPSTPTAGTSLVVQSGHGARFPAVPFMVTVHPPSEFPTLDNAEKLEVTARSVDTLTILRAQGSTTAKAIESGWRISNSLFLADIPIVDSTSVDAAGATMNTDTNVKTNSWVLDEDTMSSNVDTKVPTQQSVKAYIDSSISTAKQALLPVGSVVVLGVSTSPATLYGFGTWARIQGRFIAGVSDSDGTYDLDDTGGATSHSHTLGGTGYANIAGEGANLRMERVDGGSVNHSHKQGGFTSAAFETYNTTLKASLSGNTQTVNNLPPFIAKYIWQRTA